MDVPFTIEKIKELIRKGNASRVVVKRGGAQIVNIPVNVGIVGVVVGLSAAKWALLATVLATIGFGCTIEIIKEDGAVVNVMDEESNQKVREFAAETVEKVKDSIPVTISVDVKHDSDDVIDAEVTDLPEDNQK